MPPLVLRPTQRRLTSVLALFAVLSFALLPAEHVHARTADGHHAIQVHRHFEPHHPPGTGGMAIDGDDDHDVQWLTNSCTGRVSEARVHPGRLAVEHGLAVSQPELTLDGMVQTLFVSVPDPPWTISTGPRAPPAVHL